MQVGKEQTDDYKTVLGYPVELMAKLDDPALNYESKWTTLTFEIK